MRTSRLLPLLTAGAVVVGGATAVLAEVGGAGDDIPPPVEPGGAVLSADESADLVSPTPPTEDTPAQVPSSDEVGPDAVGGQPDEVASADAEDAPDEESPDEEAPAPAESAEPYELGPQDFEGDPSVNGTASERGDNAEAFAEWVSGFDFEANNCHRGQTVASIARQGPESFTGDWQGHCVRLDVDHPGNRPANAGPPPHAGAEGRPDHAGPPDRDGEGPPGPPHAGQPGPPPHAGAPEGAGPPPDAGPPGGEGPPGRTGNGPPGPPPHAGPDR